MASSCPPCSPCSPTRQRSEHDPRNVARTNTIFREEALVSTSSLCGEKTGNETQSGGSEV